MSQRTFYLFAALPFGVGGRDVAAPNRRGRAEGQAAEVGLRPRGRRRC
jgi:hypothetical protein